MSNSAKKIRPNQRLRSFAGSRANPTGGMYSSRGRVTRQCYGRARTKPSIPSDLFLDRDARARATSQFPTFFFGRSAPDTGVLAGFERPLETALLNRARAADGLSRLDLRERRAGSADRKEDLGIDVTTSGSMPPVHRHHPHLTLRPRRWNIVKGFSKGTRTNIRRGFARSKYLTCEKNRYSSESLHASLTIRQIPPLPASYIRRIHIRTEVSNVFGRDT